MDTAFYEVSVGQITALPTALRNKEGAFAVFRHNLAAFPLPFSNRFSIFKHKC